jgi:cell cycle arrest protein BUB3
MTIEHSDGITRVLYCGASLVSTDWDGVIKVQAPNEATYTLDAPILDAVSLDDKIVAGCLNNSIYSVSLESETKTLIGHATGSVKALAASSPSTIYAGTWGKELSAWDLRENAKCVQKVELPQKVFSMDIHENTLLVACSNRLIYLYDRRTLHKPIQVGISMIEGVCL